MKLTGRSTIGFESGAAAHEVFYAMNPKNGERLDPVFFSAAPDEVDRAASLAHEAFATYERVSARDRGAFLRAIAANIESIIEELVERVAQETALPKARLQGETARTCGQLRLFADVVEEGLWVQARIDRGRPDSNPAPKPDIRSMLRPLVPVVVFAGSNFPLAFSVAGGGSASAYAAGCPVVGEAPPPPLGTG